MRLAGTQACPCSFLRNWVTEGEGEGKGEAVESTGGRLRIPAHLEDRPFPGGRSRKPSSLSGTRELGSEDNGGEAPASWQEGWRRE